MDIDDLLRMYTYNDWANRECLTAIRAVNPVPSGTIQRMAHILSAQKLWLERILRRPQSTAVWPDYGIEECVALADEISSAWRAYFTKLATQSLIASAALGESVEYHNSKGELWSSRVEDILLHVLFHSAYHRGQIALQMRASGGSPAYTDFIHAVRQGFVE